jgi:hypothetical protein
VAWPKFKKDIFPLGTDEDVKKKAVSEEQIRNTWDKSQWDKFFKKSPGQEENKAE